MAFEDDALYRHEQGEFVNKVLSDLRIAIKKHTKTPQDVVDVPMFGYMIQLLIGFMAFHYPITRSFEFDRVSLSVNDVEKEKIVTIFREVVLMPVYLFCNHTEPERRAKLEPDPTQARTVLMLICDHLYDEIQESIVSDRMRQTLRRL